MSFGPGYGPRTYVYFGNVNNTAMCDGLYNSKAIFRVYLIFRNMET